VSGIRRVDLRVLSRGDIECETQDGWRCLDWEKSLTALTASATTTVSAMSTESTTSTAFPSTLTKDCSHLQRKIDDIQVLRQ